MDQSHNTNILDIINTQEFAITDSDDIFETVETFFLKTLIDLD